MLHMKTLLYNRFTATRHGGTRSMKQTPGMGIILRSLSMRTHASDAYGPRHLDHLFQFIELKQMEKTFGWSESTACLALFDMRSLPASTFAKLGLFKRAHPIFSDSTAVQIRSVWCHVFHRASFNKSMSSTSLCIGLTVTSSSSGIATDPESSSESCSHETCLSKPARKKLVEFGIADQMNLPTGETIKLQRKAWKSVSDSGSGPMER